MGAAMSAHMISRMSSSPVKNPTLAGRVRVYTLTSAHAPVTVFRMATM